MEKKKKKNWRSPEVVIQVSTSEWPNREMQPVSEYHETLKKKGLRPSAYCSLSELVIKCSAAINHEEEIQPMSKYLKPLKEWV